MTGRASPGSEAPVAKPPNSSVSLPSDDNLVVDCFDAVNLLDGFLNHLLLELGGDVSNYCDSAFNRVDSHPPPHVGARLNRVVDTLMQVLIHDRNYH